MRSLAVQHLVASGSHWSWVSIYSIYTRGAPIPTQSITCWSSLYRLQLPGGTNGIWVPHRGSVLQNWAYITFICQSLDLSVANVNIAPDKAKSTIGFIANNVNMLVPTEVTMPRYLTWSTFLWPEKNVLLYHHQKCWSLIGWNRVTWPAL